MFITTDDVMWRIDFNPMDDLDILCHTDDTFIVRTNKLLEALLFVQQAWWRLSELIPDDTDWKEFNILVYVKHRDEEN